jgi:hypothetical protein
MYSSIFSRACLALTVTLSSITCLAAVLNDPRARAQTLDFSKYGNQVAERSDSSLVGYLGAFFLGADPYVYFYLSNQNDPTSFKALNRGSPVIRPTKGTGGVRDPAIVRGGGDEAGNKWYIVGTDLDIGKVGLAPASFERSVQGRACNDPMSKINIHIDFLGRCAEDRV